MVLKDFYSDSHSANTTSFNRETFLFTNLQSVSGKNIAYQPKE
jgi:hypothetical protein